MDKKTFLFEAMVIAALLIYYVVWIEIPDIKKSLGSSDHFINTSSYQSAIEINIDKNTHFMYVLNQENKVYYLFFLNQSSTILYNQNIEGLSYKDAFSKSISLLKQKRYLKDISNVSIIVYSNVSKNIISSLQEELFDTNNVTIENSTLKELAIRRNISEDSDVDSILRNLSMESLELASDNS